MMGQKSGMKFAIRRTGIYNEIIFIAARIRIMQV
jgi:hypothetical protein